MNGYHLAAIRELIARDKNHPCVVAWSITNEPDSSPDNAYDYFKPLVDETRRLDPSRPVTYASVMFVNAEKDKIAALFDVICLNRYFGWYTDAGDLKPQNGCWNLIYGRGKRNTVCR